MKCIECEERKAKYHHPEHFEDGRCLCGPCAIEVSECRVFLEIHKLSLMEQATGIKSSLYKTKDLLQTDPTKQEPE